MQCAKDTTIESLRPKTIVMSPPYWGKTRFAATFPGNSYFFDFDGNMLTLEVLKLPNIFWDTFKDNNLKAPTALENANKVLDAMAKSVAEKGFVEYEGIKFDHIVIDSASTLLEACMNKQLFIKGKAGAQPTSSDWQSNDWTGQMVYFNGFVNRVLALPCAVTLNCHEHMDKQETELEKHVYPDITGKTATKISSRFHVTFRLAITVDPKDKSESHRVLTKSQGIYYAGHRFADCLDLYEEADWRVILEKVNKYLGREQS